MRHYGWLVVCALAACYGTIDSVGGSSADDGIGVDEPQPISTSCALSCHGDGSDPAPPKDTTGAQDTSAVGVGAHRVHLGASTWRKAIECTACHQVPQAVGDPGHTDTPRPAELVFGGVAEGSLWDHDAQTCTTYCHGATLSNTVGGVAGGTAGGEIAKPTWTIVDGSQTQCQSCHGYPPPSPHPQDPDCGSCHPTMTPGADRVIAYPELHVDGHLDVIDTAPCDSCHGADGQPAPPRDTAGQTATTFRGVGAHAQHMTKGSSWHAPLDCVQCHRVPAGINDQGHVDSPLPAEVVFDAFAGAGMWNGATCSNTYCHGGGTSPLTGGITMSPTWTQVDGTQAQCGSCHGAPPPPPHPVSSDCGSCHPTMLPGAQTTIAYPELHIDGKVDVNTDRPCDACHGSNGNFAPPKDTTGGTTTDLRGVGAHQNHLAPSTWRKDIVCTDCHKVPDAVIAIGHIDSPLPAELTFSTLAGTPTWNGSTCTNTYCHGATLNAGGTSRNPVWTNVTGAQGQCGSCHGTPPPSPHPADTDCGKCHDTMTAGGGLVITDPARHIDGNLDVNTDLACHTCHGSLTNNAPPKDTLGNTATTARGVGAHQQHLATTNRFMTVACTDCHRVPTTVTSVGHIDTALPAELAFSARSGTTTQWNGSRCSNNYCHGATLGAGGTTTAPLWTTVNGSQATCASCHGNPPPSPHPQVSDCGQCHPDVKIGSPTEFTDATKHVDGNLDVTNAAACNSCHGGAANNAPPKDVGGNTATTTRGVGAHQAHLVTGSTWHKDTTCNQCHRVPTAVDSTGHLDTALPAELTWTGIAMGSTFNGTSCTSYCHGSTLGAGGSATTAVWTRVDGTQKTCASCHGNPPPAPHPQDSNCSSCHPDGGTGGTFSNPAQHIDGVLQVDAVHPTGYGARDKHGYDFDRQGSGTCATASCHGTSLAGGTTGGPSCNSCHAGWQTTCTFCHGGTANTTGAPPQGVLGQTAASDAHVGAHTKHVVGSSMHVAWDCTVCHTKPSSALSPAHIDGTGGVVQAEVHYNNLNTAGTFSAGTASCSNLYCHGNGRTVSGAVSWTSTTALACNSCHATNGTGMSGRHSKHIGRGYACSVCHQSVIASGSTTITTPALHVNGAREVRFSSGGTYNTSTKSCSGLASGCHGTKSW